MDAPDGPAEERSRVETLAESDGDGRPRAPPEDELVAGSTVGRYVVLQRIGGGGMGVVYAAYDPELDRKIALKLLRRRRAEGSHDEVDRLRMLREAQALARLSHPNVVAVHDAGLVDGRVFLAMDFVEGQDLRKWVASARPSRREIVDAYVQAARGLAAAHVAGLVHRDFKPDNAVRDASGRVQVLDFGLARGTGNTGPQREVSQRDRDAMLRRIQSDRSTSLDTPVTHVGARLGTPAYMAPEQHVGDPTDAKSDQFALCVALHEALYGRLPFAGETVASLAVAVVEGRMVQPPRGARVPAWLRRVIVRGLQTEPGQRWPSLDALVVELQRDPGRGRRRAAMVIGVGAVVAVPWWLNARDADAPCSQAAQRVAQVWDDTRRDAVRTTFVATGRPYGERAADAVVARVDGWAADWQRAHTDACEATHVRKEQSPDLLDLRMACLDRKLVALDALVVRMADADGAVVDRAQEAALGLADVEACADATQLRAEARGRSTEADPQRVAEIERELVDLEAATVIGHAKGALAGARAVLADARALGEPRLVAEAAYRLGFTLEAVGDYREAAETLIEAATVAEAIDRPLLLGEIRRMLVLVDGDRLAAFERGHLWARLAEAALARGHAPPQTLAHLANTRAYVFEREGKPDESLAQRRHGYELLADGSEGDLLLLASIEADLAYALADRRELDEATRLVEHALATWTRLLGPDHRRTAHGHAAFAYVLDARSRYPEALEHHARAAAIVEASVGPDDPMLASVRQNAAISAIALGDLERGEGEFRRALEAVTATYGEEHVEVAETLGNLAGVVRMRGRLGEAERIARRSLAMRERLLPADHPEVGSSLATLANVLEGLGRHEEVVPLRERVVVIDERSFGVDHPTLVVDLGNLGYSAMLAGDLRRARSAAERALAITERHEATPEHAAFARVVLARVLAQERRGDPRVRELVEAAQEKLGELPAEVERKLIAEIAAREGWRERPK